MRAGKEQIKRIVRRLGYDIERRDLSHPARRAAAMQTRGVDLVLDIGANLGQYVDRLRDFGYDGRIVSFEPLPDAFRVLEEAHRHDVGWSGRQTAAGASTSVAQLNVSVGSDLSSFLDVRSELLSVLPGAEVHDVVTVPVVALDDVWDEIVPDGATVMVKIDVQGFEHAVLDGIADRLKDVPLVEIEMSLQELYEGGSSLYDLLPRLTEAGFHVISMDNGFIDSPTGQVLDIDLLAGR